MFFEENYEDNFSEVQKHGGISVSNLFDDSKKLFLFRMPSNLVNPSDLINKQIVISKKNSKIDVKGEMLEIAAQDNHSLQESSLLIPDSLNGTLIPVTKKFSCQVMLKATVPVATSEDIDLSSYKDHKLKLPNLKQRDFFGCQEMQDENDSSKHRRRSSGKRLLPVKCEVAESEVSELDVKPAVKKKRKKSSS